MSAEIYCFGLWAECYTREHESQSSQVPSLGSRTIKRSYFDNNNEEKQSQAIKLDRRQISKVRVANLISE